MVALCSVASGQSYTVEYEGGRWTSTGPDEPCSGDYGLSGAYWGAAPTSGGGTNNHIHAGIGTATCSGTITAHCRWPTGTGAPPLPPAVIIVQECETGWAGDTGSASDGLGDPELGWPYFGLSGGTYVTALENPAASFDVTISPSSTATLNANSQSGLPSALAYVSFKVTVYPVDLILTGSTSIDGKPWILTGQQLLPTVSLGGYTPEGAVSYTWTAEGARPFKNYVVSSPSPTTGTLTDWATENTTVPSTTVYFAKEEGATVGATMNLQAEGASFHVEKDLTVKRPKLLFPTKKRDIGTMQILPNQQSPVELLLTGAQTPSNPPKTFGIFILEWVTTPSEFTPNGWGKFFDVQLVTDRSTYLDGGQPHYWQPLRGIGLDGEYPYGSEEDAIVQPSGAYHLFRDNPGIGFGNTNYMQFDYDADFETYIMYRPPNSAAGGSLPVPRFETRWHAGGTALRGTPNWSGGDVNSGFLSENEAPLHPVWTQIIAGG